MRFLQHSDYPCPRLLALWDAPRSPENEIVRVLCGFRRTSPPNECPVAGRSLKWWFMGGVRRRDTFGRADRLTDIRAG